MSSRTSNDLETAAQLFSGALKHPEPSKAAAYAYRAATLYKEAQQTTPSAMLQAFADAAYGFATARARQLTQEKATNVSVDIAFAIAAAYRHQLKGHTDNLLSRISQEQNVLTAAIHKYGPGVVLQMRYGWGNTTRILPRDMLVDIDAAISMCSELSHILAEEENRSVAEENLAGLVELRAQYS